MHGLISLAVRTCLLAVVFLVHASCPQSVEASRAGAAPPRVTFILQLASGAVTGLSPDTEVDVEVRAVPVSTTIDATTVVLQTDPSHLRVIGWVGGREFDQVLLPGTDLGGGRFRLDVGRTQGPWPSTPVLVATFTVKVGPVAPTSTTVSLVSSGAVRTRVASDQVEVAYDVVALELGGLRGPGPSPTQVSPSPVVVVPEPRPEVPAPRPAPVSPPPVAVRTPVTGVTLTPVALPAVAPPTASPLRSVAVWSIPAGFEPGERPVGKAFSEFYSAQEGMRLLGRPMGDAFVTGQGGLAVQYFEKGRLEYHPEEASPGWQFLLGLLASELIDRAVELPVGGDASSMTYADLARLRVAGLRIPPPEGFGGGFAVLDDGSVFVPFDASLAPGPGHAVPPMFWAFLNATTVFPGGWLHDVGLPLTPVAEVIVSKGPETGRRILVQAFQRTILTFDPLNPSDYQVECANVGTDFVRSGGVEGRAGG